MTRVEGVRDESGFGEGESKGLLFLGEIGRGLEGLFRVGFCRT